VLTSAQRLGPSGDPGDRSPDEAAASGRFAAGGEDLPYKVELWSEGKTAIEQVLAVTVSASIGYAAYYAATREFPHRFITLRHRDKIVSRWNGPSH